MAQTKFYAVAKGKKTGIYFTWDDCKEQVNGVSNARYKSFKTMEEALIYLDKFKVVLTEDLDKLQEEAYYTHEAIKVQSIIDRHERNKHREKIPPIKSTANVKSLKEYLNPKDIFYVNPNAYIAFVDGSYNKDEKIYGSGVCILNNNLDFELGLTKAGEDIWDQWNIVGELEATKLALLKAKELNQKNVFIYHDLKNISLWATGEWKAKNEYTQEYVRFIEDISKEMNIQFIKVKGHSNNKYNDEADRLADLSIKNYMKGL